MTTNDQIISATTCHDPERFRYELENKLEYINGGLAIWPNRKWAFDIYSEWIDCYNSESQIIAIFKLKAWK